MLIAANLCARCSSCPLESLTILVTVLLAATAKCIADARVSPEGREGIAAFLEKRVPAWVPKK